jgi:hypothetical protein
MNEMALGTLVVVLESLFGLGVFALLALRLIPGYRLDLFRQQVFCVRDDLFDYARAGNIAFSHPAYRLLRQSANGFIRYGHRLTFYRVVTTIIVGRIMGDTPKLIWTQKWTRAVDSLDADTKADLNRFHERLLMLIVKRLVSGSPFLIGVLFMMAFTTLCSAGIKSAREALKTSARGAVTRVIDTRLLEEEAARAAAI